METVQLQCGHCKQVIAIGVEHLGGQVQCPHCAGVLQTPPRPTQAAPAPALFPNPEVNERESIFAGAEASDSILGEPARPSVEMPTSAPAASEPHADLTKFKPRPIFDRGVVSLYGLIFLVPYAILTTLAIIYLVFFQGSPPRTHPFDMMPDPAGTTKQGAPKKAGGKVDSLHPLADHQKIALGKSVRLGKDGELEVTAEKVRLVHDDLRLFLRVKNVSKNLAFKPIDDSYLRFIPDKSEDPPYSYLETPSEKVSNIYGAYLAYRKNVQDEAAGRETLGPGEETVIVLTTMTDTFRNQKSDVADIAAGSDRHVWRVQLRRGLVKYRGKDVSATAVIGVVFSGAQIEKG